MAESSPLFGQSLAMWQPNSCRYRLNIAVFILHVASIHVSKYITEYRCIRTCVYVFNCKCMYTHTHIYIHIYIYHIYIYIHLSLSVLSPRSNAQYLFLYLMVGPLKPQPPTSTGGADVLLPGAASFLGGESIW